MSDMDDELFNSILSDKHVVLFVHSSLFQADAHTQNK